MLASFRPIWVVVIRPRQDDESFSSGGSAQRVFVGCDRLVEHALPRADSATLSRPAAPSRRRDSRSSRSRSIAARRAAGSPARSGCRCALPRPRSASRRPSSQRRGGRVAIASSNTMGRPRGATAGRPPLRAQAAARPACGRRSRARLARENEAARLLPPRVASTSSRMPFSGERRPTKRISGGSASSPTSAGISTPFGIQRTSVGPGAPRRLSERLGHGDHDARAEEGHEPHAACAP